MVSVFSADTRGAAYDSGRGTVINDDRVRCHRPAVGSALPASNALLTAFDHDSSDTPPARDPSAAALAMAVQALATRSERSAAASPRPSTARRPDSRSTACLAN